MDATENLQIKNISERVSIGSTKTIWSLVIIPAHNKMKLYGLLLWILAWTISGLLIISSYKLAKTENQKLFIIIFMFFWLYYEWKIINAFMWRKGGKEKLWIKDNFLFIEESGMIKKTVRKFRVEDINSITEEEFNEKSFSDFMSDSFWNKGKPRIKINVLGKDYFFGYQISDKETKEIVRSLSNRIFARQKNIS